MTLLRVVLATIVGFAVAGVLCGERIVNGARRRNDRPR